MEPINNANAVNYPVTMSQPQAYEDDYSTPPMAYDDVYAEKSKAASNMSGLAILGTIGLAGAALWGGHALGKKGAKNALETAENATKEALAKADKLQKANDEAYKIANKEKNGNYILTRNLRRDIKNALRPDEAKKAEAEAENTANKATEAAQEVAESAS